MNAFAFDTHAFVKRLTAVGMPEAQAEALADEQVRLIDDRLATKEDIARLEAATKIDIARLEAVTKADIAPLEAVTKADIARLETAMRTDIARLESAMKTDIAHLETAMKTDIARLEAATKRDTRESELRFEGKIDVTKAETLKWIIGAMGFQTIVILSALLGLVRLAAH